MGIGEMGSVPTKPVSYDQLVASEGWQNRLRALNLALIESLTAVGEAPSIGGSPFYRHMQQGSIVTGKFTTRNDIKRRRLFDLARLGTHWFEIGVNGGHGMLLAKSANPELKCVGIDICQTVGAGNPRADIYCPTAMRWLEQQFPGDMRFMIGSSLELLPPFVRDNPGMRIDILRIDGARRLYFSDFMAMRPLLHKGSYVVFDDPGWPACRETVQKLMEMGELRPDPQFSPMDKLFNQDPVMRLA